MAEASPGADPQEMRRAATRRKVREHRQRLRAQGMRPIQIWVPDVHAPEFAAEARRQSRVAKESPEEAEIQSFSEPTDLPLFRTTNRLMVDKVTTVPRSCLSHCIGRLAADDVMRFNRSLLVFLGLAR